LRSWSQAKDTRAAKATIKMSVSEDAIATNLDFQRKMVSLLDARRG
jgi:hypothetical protein